MEVYICRGVLVLKPQTFTESYALEQWQKQSLVEQSPTESAYKAKAITVRDYPPRSVIGEG